MHETHVNSMIKFEEQVMGSLNSTIKSIASHHKIDEIRFSDLETKQRDIPRHEKQIAALKSQVIDLQEKTTDVSDVCNFISKSLPILLHVSICESLKKVLGPDYEESLLEFEKFKTKQIFMYS